LSEQDDCPNTCKAITEGECCENCECRYWIDYPEDLNCTFVAIRKHGGMALSEVAKRLDLSLVRISQIEKKAVALLYKRIKI